MSEDYVFRYKLDLDSGITAGLYQHRLTELVRVILENLLNVILPLEAGKEIKIDGFKWLNNSKESYQIFSKTNDWGLPSDFVEKGQSPGSTTEGQRQWDYQDARNTVFYEPRIDFIKKSMESLLSLIELEKEGQVVEADGFRLKNLQDWLGSSSGDPGEILDYTGSHCNCDCMFCCNKGNPPSIATHNNLNRTAEEEFKEIKTRLKYFSPRAGRSLFPSIGSIYEVMMHPYFMEVLHLVREKTSRPFRITTNGQNLIPEVIAQLAEFKPIYLYLSLNSSSPWRRQRLMKDTNPETAINSLPLLRQKSIPYAAVIVPWPMETLNEMLEDLSSTVAYAAEHEAHLIEINLPGHSRYFSSTELFDLDQVWRAIVSQIGKLRGEYDCPIVVMPAMYEENICQARKNLPQIIGLVKNSPASLGGLKRGDIITRINGLPVRDRPQARDLLNTLHQGEIKNVTLTLQRDSQTLERSLDLTRYFYPYSEDIDAYLGIVFMGTGLRMSYLERLKESIQAHQAARVLFLSSELVRPTFEQCLAESHLFSSSQFKIDIEVPKNDSFGGNIFMGDLLLVQDFIDCIKQYITKKGYKPDLVVIPSSPFNLSGWGRDLAGRVYLDIEREIGAPVELLDCATIFA